MNWDLMDLVGTASMHHYHTLVGHSVIISVLKNPSDKLCDERLSKKKENVFAGT